MNGKKSVKIVTIGGGSSYTPELVEGFIKRYDSLPVKELWLVDIESGKEKMEIVANLARRMVKQAGIPMEIHTTLNRREALRDADFVTTQLRVGGLLARIKDERIPLSHGILGQETNGAGGLFKGMRTIPVIMDICKDMEEICKDAWLINFTNPVGMVMEGIKRHTNFQKIIGLCNVPIGMYKAIADLMGRKIEEVEVTFGGLNHMVFATKVMIDGVDVTKEAIKKWGNQTVKNIKGVIWEPDFLEGLEVLPCSYHRYYYMTKEYLEEALEKFKEHKVRAEFVKEVENQLFEIYKDPELCEKPKLLEERGGAYYSDAACSLIDSIYNDKGDIQVVNTVNNNAIKNFESDEIIEASCKITKNGPMPVEIGELPKAVNGLIQQIKSFEVIGSRAAVTGDKKIALLALMINPLVMSQKTAKIVLDELLEAHKEYLPQFFNKTIKTKVILTENIEEQRKAYDLYMQSVCGNDMLHESMDFFEFKQKLFGESKNIKKICLLEMGGKAFASGCIDWKNKKAFITMVLVDKKERRKGLGRKLLDKLENELFAVSGYNTVEISFYNPITFSWRIPKRAGNHPNTPGVDMESIAYDFFLACGYNVFAIQKSYYLWLQNYRDSDKIILQKETLAKKGFTFEVFDDRIHRNMTEVIEAFKNPMWIQEILSEQPVYEGGRPILVPVYHGEVCGFTGPLDVEKSMRGYFAGIGISEQFQKKGLGKILFCLLCMELKNKGADFMTLFTGENNPAARIYEEAGFEVVRTFADLRKEKKK